MLLPGERKDIGRRGVVARGKVCIGKVWCCCQRKGLFREGVVGLLQLLPRVEIVG